MKTPTILLLAASIAVLTTTATRAETTETIVQGDFQGLESWNPNKMKLDGVGVEPVIKTTNSPFTEVYPNNGRAVELTGIAASNNPVVLSQKTSTIYDGKGKLQFDIYIPQTLDSKFGWSISITAQEDQEFLVAGLLIYEKLSLRKQNAQGQVLLRDKFDAGQWYHFEATLDLDSQT